MCQRTGKTRKVLTAKKDIEVWKCVRTISKNDEVDQNACYAKIYCDYKYRKGKTAKGKYQGRAFNDRIYRLKRDSHRQVIVLDDEGFHSYTSRFVAEHRVNSRGFCLGLFVIPKGSRYVAGMDGLGYQTVVSANIRFEKLITK